jgi:hypothetical protein
MYDYVKMGYWIVLPYSAVRHLPQLKLDPSGVIPQRERRPRAIMDYSYNYVNQAALPVAPLQAMQFGWALQRILQRLAYCNPAYGPRLMAKIVMSDGYYRVPLAPHAALEPYWPTSQPAYGVSHSPPYFCAFPETCADLANNSPFSHTSHPLYDATQGSVSCPPPLTFHPSATIMTRG